MIIVFKYVGSFMNNIQYLGTLSRQQPRTYIPNLSETYL
jgi:hypothetical protein